MGTKNDPGKFDCYKAAEPDEPMFVLLGRDPAAAAAVILWVKLRQFLGESLDSPKMQEALACSTALNRWALDHGKMAEVQRLADPSIRLLLELNRVRLEAEQKT